MWTCIMWLTYSVTRSYIFIFQPITGWFVCMLINNCRLIPHSLANLCFPLFFLSSDEIWPSCLWSSVTCSPSSKPSYPMVCFRETTSGSLKLMLQSFGEDPLVTSEILIQILNITWFNPHKRSQLQAVTCLERGLMELNLPLTPPPHLYVLQDHRALENIPSGPPWVPPNQSGFGGHGPEVHHWPNLQRLHLRVRVWHLHQTVSG